MKKLLLPLVLVLFAANALAKVEELTIRDATYNKTRRIWVYTPAAYDASKTNNLLILFDGESYVNDIPAPAMLDALLARKAIAPTVAVLVDTSDARLGDLANHQQFADFVAKELLPWVRARYRVTSDARGVIAGGYSAGGLAAAYVAFRHPEAIGNVLSQSGAFWRGNEGASTPGEWLTEQFAASKKLPIRFSIEVGARETQRVVNGAVFVEANRRLRDVLRAKGYEVRYVEVPGAQHEPAHWSAAFSDALIAVDAPAR
ncbi:MAG TPA: alpha/beta hydrolase-fold protein [Thermoanaerobaculia bacterium]|nr:alpha/beta hydrolase-fold protein [Thermoanaerobaculia bacterium]